MYLGPFSKYVAWERGGRRWRKQQKMTQKGGFLMKLCRCGLFMHKCVYKNSVMSDVILYLVWYKVIHLNSHICKKYYFFIIPTLSFFIQIWDLVSFWVPITTSHSKIRKKMFLWSQDQNTKCQFKLTLVTIG